MAKKKIYLSLAVIAVVLTAYIARVAYVNRNNALTKQTYMSDDKPVVRNGLEYTVIEEKLYDMAAFIKDYPAVEQYYRYAGSVYEANNDMAMLQAIKYQLFIKVKIKNISSETQRISSYEIYSGAYSNGVNPDVIGALNALKNDGNIKPGEEKTVLYSYDLNEKSFRKARYQNIEKQQFSLLLSKMPDITYINLTHVKKVCADQDAKKKYKELTTTPSAMDTVSMPDTKTGTLLTQGEKYVGNGIAQEVEDCVIVSNLKDYAGFEQSAVQYGDMSERVDRDGAVYGYDGRKKVAGKGYLVFVKLKCVNTADSEKEYRAYPYLYNKKGQAYCEPFYIKMDRAEEQGTLFEEGEQREVWYGYHVKTELNKWKLPNAALYLQYTGMEQVNVDLEKGKTGMGIFLEVQ